MNSFGIQDMYHLVRQIWMPENGKLYIQVPCFNFVSTCTSICTCLIASYWKPRGSCKIQMLILEQVLFPWNLPVLNQIVIFQLHGLFSLSSLRHHFFCQQELLITQVLWPENLILPALQFMTTSEDQITLFSAISFMGLLQSMLYYCEGCRNFSELALLQPLFFPLPIFMLLLFLIC